MRIAKKLSGFTTLELIIAISLMIIVTTITVVSLRGLFFRESADSISNQIVAHLQDARKRSIAVEEGAQWGVHIESVGTAQFVAVFRGTSWATDSSTAAGRLALPSNVRIENVTINGPLGVECTTNCDVMFDFAGKTENYGTTNGNVALQVVSGETTFSIVVTPEGKIDRTKNNNEGSTPTTRTCTQSDWRGGQSGAADTFACPPGTNKWGDKNSSVNTSTGNLHLNTGETTGTLDSPVFDGGSEVQIKELEWLP